MKIVLKRRKHRNGVKPTRKGTLKVNLQELPTAHEQLQSISALMRYREKHAPIFDAFDHLKAGNKAEFERIIRTSKALNRLHDFMLKGHDHLKEYKPIEPMNLALAAINEDNPQHFKREEFDSSVTCSACKHDCPFTTMDLSEDRLIRMCPFVRHAFQDYALDKNNILPLDQSEMANLALTHLS